MFICEKCRERIDPSAPDVVRLIRLDKVERTGDAPATRVEGPGVYLHKRHAPKLRNEWRLPTKADEQLAQGSPAEDAPLPLDEP
jgi:hypothetical protein